MPNSCRPLPSTTTSTSFRRAPRPLPLAILVSTLLPAAVAIAADGAVRGTEADQKATTPSAFVSQGSNVSPALADSLAGETPRLPGHVLQSEIDNGHLNLGALREAGKFLFSTEFNLLDGFGRPAATGNGTPSKRPIQGSPFMTRASAPETNSCLGCHNKPEAGGAGDFVANVFVLAQVLDPVTESIAPEFSDERNTLGMHGAGAIELLAREMSVELRGQKSAAIAQAQVGGQDVTQALSSKGVQFGQLVAHPDGTVDSSGISGVDPDLVIKPFHQKGVVPSLRVFTVNAFNHHHGLEAVERFGRARTGEDDFDQDGVSDELSAGDITAATVWQASLQIPGRVIPADPKKQAAIKRGEASFAKLGCADCHRPSLVLESPTFSEPGPFNPPGNLQPGDVTAPFRFDLTKEGPTPHLERLADGRAVVRAFTDLKRHRICDDQDQYFNNEKVKQGGVPTDVFITRKLWDVGSSSPYGHRGDLTTLTEAILHHAGEARASREQFAALDGTARGEIIAFLKSLQVLPAGSPRELREAAARDSGGDR